jgi:hypothetical protein
MFNVLANDADGEDPTARMFRSKCEGSFLGRLMMIGLSGNGRPKRRKRLNLSWKSSMQVNNAAPV